MTTKSSIERVAQAGGVLTLELFGHGDIHDDEDAKEVMVEYRGETFEGSRKGQLAFRMNNGFPNGHWGVTAPGPPLPSFAMTGVPQARGT